MNDAMGLPQTAVVLGGTSEIAQRGVAGSGPSSPAPHRPGRARRRTSEHRSSRARGSRRERAPGAFDITETSRHDSLAAEAVRHLGQIDLVLVSAGVLGDQASDESDPEAVRNVFETNCTGPVSAMTAFAAVLHAQGHGRMVVLSSVAGVHVRRANYVYGASKAGLDAFAQGMATALDGSGASLMIVRPGWVATRMTTGRHPAPFATTPEAVAVDIVAGLQEDRR